jgi:hypothetical protein
LFETALLLLVGSLAGGLLYSLAGKRLSCPEGPRARYGLKAIVTLHFLVLFLTYDSVVALALSFVLGTMRALVLFMILLAIRLVQCYVDMHTVDEQVGTSIDRKVVSEVLRAIVLIAALAILMGGLNTA